ARAPAEVGARMPGARISANANGSHTCAVNGDGTVRCWGANEHFQLGRGQPIPMSAPVRAREFTGVMFVAMGGSHSCALLSGGVVFCWGNNDDHQLGIVFSPEALFPVVSGGAT